MGGVNNSDMDALIPLVFKKCNNQCLRCGSTYKLEVHHITPLSQGGKDNIDNLALLCRECHKCVPKDPKRFLDFLKTNYKHFPYDIRILNGVYKGLVKPSGNGCHIVLPKFMLGREVIIIDKQDCEQPVGILIEKIESQGKINLPKILTPSEIGVYSSELIEIDQALTLNPSTLATKQALIRAFESLNLSQGDLRLIYPYIKNRHLKEKLNWF